MVSALAKYAKFPYFGADVHRWPNIHGFNTSYNFEIEKLSIINLLLFDLINFVQLVLSFYLIKRLNRVSELKKTPIISLVVPVYNEEKSIRPFYEAIHQQLQNKYKYELVFVNDGSHDCTENEVRSLVDNEDHISITLVNLSRNFGKEAALACGLREACGDAVIPIDVDLQDPPDLLPQMIRNWMLGSKIVNARRVDRSEDSFFKRISSDLFYKVYNFMTDYPIPKNVGDFRLLDRSVVEAVLTIGERSRFNKGIFNWVGYETTEVTFSRPPRDSGISKWSSLKLLKLALDGIFTSSTLPLRIWTYLGLTMSLLAVCYGLVLFVLTLFLGNNVPGYTSTLLVILSFGALNMVALGIIGEYVGRIYEEVRQRPLYIIRSINRTK